MYIVQLETLSSLETGLYEKIELENFIDICEDGSVIGGGYTKLTELQGNKFEKIKNEIINKLVILGCIKKEYDTIYFTSMFAENFFYPYYERLKSYFANA